MQTPFGRIMEDFSVAYRQLAERVDELSRQETYYGKLDLNGYTLGITNNVSLGNVTIDDGTLDLNSHTLSLLGDLTSDAGILDLNNHTLSLSGDLISDAGTLDLNTHTLSLLGDVTIDPGTLDLNNRTLNLLSDLNFNPGVAGRLALYTATDTLDESTVAKSGSGVLTLSAASAVTFTMLSNGILDLDGATLALPVPVNQGGTGATTVSAARLALGTNDATNLTAGTLAAARLGTGATAAKMLFGDMTWDILVASDIPSLDATKITTGTLPIARGGTGATTASSALTALGGVGGSGANGGIAIWNGTTGLTFAQRFFYNINTDVLNAPGTVVAGAFSTSGLMYAGGGIQTDGQIWRLGIYAAGALSPTGYLNVTVNGTARRILVG